MVFCAIWGCEVIIEFDIVRINYLIIEFMTYTISLKIRSNQFICIYREGISK